MAILSDFKLINCVHLLSLQLSKHLSRLLKLHCVSFSRRFMFCVKLSLKLVEPRVLLLLNLTLDFANSDLFCLFGENIVRFLPFERG